MPKQKAKIAVVFDAPEGGALGGGPEAVNLFEGRKDRIANKLASLLPDDVSLTFHYIATPSEAFEVIEKTRDAVGYLIFLFNSMHALSRPIIWSGKPTVLIGETYGGSGDFLMEYSRSIQEGKPVIGLVTRDIEDQDLLCKYVRYLDVMHKLRNSNVLVITSPSTKQSIESEYPLSVNLYSVFKSVQSTFGITPILLDVKEFVKKYYPKVQEAEVKAISKKWVREAQGVIEGQTEEIVKQAKLYLALRGAIKDYDADAVAIDCIVLHRSELLEAWPCLAFMELAKNAEAVPVCEADIYSTPLLLIMKYFADRPGFINDPSPDVFTDEVVYYHCYAPVNPYGYDSGKRMPYTITPAHLGAKQGSVYVELPTDETVTVVGLDPEGRTLTLHAAKAVRNEGPVGDSTRACSVKLVCEANVEAIIENWYWRAGWHRVLFYGDWREDLKNLAKLLGLKVIEEDKA